MLELYPVAVLSASQLKNMLGQWKSKKMYIKSTSSPSPGILLQVMTNRFFKEFIPRTLHDLVFDLAHRHLRTNNMKFTYQMYQVRRLSHTWTHIQNTYDLVFIINLSGGSPKHGHVFFPCFPELQTGLRAGRLVMISRNIMSSELPNRASTPRTSLVIGVNR